MRPRRTCISASTVAATEKHTGGTRPEIAGADGTHAHDCRWPERCGENADLAGASREVLTRGEPLVAAATAAATRLAVTLNCERVAIGLLRGGEIRIEALSHSANPDPRSTLLRDVRDAMEV